VAVGLERRTVTVRARHGRQSPGPSFKGEGMFLGKTDGFNHRMEGVSILQRVTHKKGLLRYS